MLVSDYALTPRDGRFPTLRAVVEHYNKTFKLNLTNPQKKDLVQYLLSL